MSLRSAIMVGAASVALASCGEPEPMIITPPAALLTCADAPAVPETLPPQGSMEREQMTLQLWLAEREAGADCRSRVDGVAAWVREVNR